MKLETAEKLAYEIVGKLTDFCTQIEVAGSVRRRKGWVNDIDIVAVPSNQGQFAYQLAQFGKLKVGGQKIIRVAHPGITLDVYIATPETWATLLLIRTGSNEHNIMLCKRALQMGMKLHADGSGLFRLGGMVATEDAADGNFDETRIAGDTELSIFEALGMKYKKPWERD